MKDSLFDPRDSLERQNEKLLKITGVLMRRVEKAIDDTGEAYAHFQRSLVLEEEVRERTRDLAQTLDLLNDSNARLSEAHREAEQARSDLSNALEAVQEGFALFDADDVLVMCNSRFCMHVPEVRARLSPGLGFADYVRLVSESTHLSLSPGDSPEAWARRRLQKHAEAHVNFNVHFDGDRCIQVSEHRTPDRGTAILQTDVTDMIRLERQERERLLDDQARLIRTTLEHINQGICIFDSQRRLVSWNGRLGALLNPPMSVLRVGRSFDRLLAFLASVCSFPPDRPPESFAAWVRGADGREPLSFDLEHQGERYLAVVAREMPDRGFVVSFTDTTAEKQALREVYAVNETLERRVLERTLALEDALDDAERANASKSRFVAAASHDLLQPLSAAKLFLASLGNASLEDEQMSIVRRTQSSLNSVESILAALLEISRLDSGTASADLSSFPLNRVLEPVCDELEPFARRKGLALRVVPSSLTVRSDRAYLRRILQNLVANAIRYTGEGKILVGARRLGASLRIEVWDTGPGISEADQEVIFKEFQRLPAAGGGGEGVGLGLSIVERACALLGHPLDLRSEEGRGTGFLVTVPLSEQRPPAIAPCAAGAAEGPDLGLIALVVENDRNLRRAIASLMNGWGVSVFDVHDRAEALALLADVEMRPDLLIVDYHLDRGENGLDAIAALRESHGALPAILMTADQSPGLRRACEERGVVYMNKPVDPVELRNTLSAISGA